MVANITIKLPDLFDRDIEVLRERTIYNFLGQHELIGQQIRVAQLSKQKVEKHCLRFFGLRGERLLKDFFLFLCGRLSLKAC